MLDPEQLTFAQWFWICFVMILAITFACRCIDLTSPDEPITNERVEAPMGPSSVPATQPAGNGQGQGR